MTNSRERQRRWDRQLKLWRAVIEAELEQERAAQGLQPDDRIPDQIIVNEVLEMADPERYPPMDAVIPAPRRDLARAWIKGRLEGRLDTEAQRQEFARTLAPIPDGKGPPLRLPVSLDSSGESVRKAAERRRKS